MDSGKKRILVVDDDPVNARVAAGIARFGGFEVRECHGVLDAADVARAWRPDLVVADMVMPEMDGSELCVILKSDAGTRDVPVLFVTAHDVDVYGPLARFCGGADLLVKPCAPVKLLRAINRLLGRVRETAVRS